MLPQDPYLGIFIWIESFQDLLFESCAFVMKFLLKHFQLEERTGLANAVSGRVFLGVETNVVYHVADQERLDGLGFRVAWVLEVFFRLWLWRVLSWVPIKSMNIMGWYHSVWVFDFRWHLAAMLHLLHVNSLANTLAIFRRIEHTLVIIWALHVERQFCFQNF